MTRRKNRLIEKSVGECSEDKHWDSIRPANMSRNKNEDERIKILSDAARSFMEEKRSMIVRQKIERESVCKKAGLNYLSFKELTEKLKRMANLNGWAVFDPLRATVNKAILIHYLSDYICEDLMGNATVKQMNDINEGWEELTELLKTEESNLSENMPLIDIVVGITLIKEP